MPYAEKSGCWMSCPIRDGRVEGRSGEGVGYRTRTEGTELRTLPLGPWLGQLLHRDTCWAAAAATAHQSIFYFFSFGPGQPRVSRRIPSPPLHSLSSPFTSHPFPSTLLPLPSLRCQQDHPGTTGPGSRPQGITRLEY